ncbi:MAG: hypothetical protein AAGH48_11255 [Pseudomonadota bacterium]
MPSERLELWIAELTDDLLCNTLDLRQWGKPRADRVDPDQLGDGAERRLRSWTITAVTKLADVHRTTKAPTVVSEPVVPLRCILPFSLELTSGLAASIPIGDDNDNSFHELKKI